MGLSPSLLKDGKKIEKGTTPKYYTAFNVVLLRYLK